MTSKQALRALWRIHDEAQRSIAALRHLKAELRKLIRAAEKGTLLTYQTTKDLLPDRLNAAQDMLLAQDTRDLEDIAMLLSDLPRGRW